MKDLQDIIALARADRGARAALATLFKVDGSSYRRPGASMLATPDGQRAGGISGGCLERDIERHAREVLASGQPRVVVYDTQSEADLIVGTGLGCGGRLEILVEPIELNAEFGPVARWAGALDRREALAEVIAVAEAASSPALPPGWRLFLWSHVAKQGAHHDLVASPSAVPLADIVDKAETAAREALAQGRSSLIEIETARGPLPAFVRVVTPPVQLLVCGAGDDATPLVRMANALGWYVRVIDHRAAFATRDRFADAAHVDVAVAGELPSTVRLDNRTVAIVMNHNFAADSAWLRALAPLPLPYLGVLGARARTQRLLRETALDRLDPAALSHVFAPAGLDIGAEGADQIALAIVSEIQAVLASRSGTSLRDRPSRPADAEQQPSPTAQAAHSAPVARDSATDGDRVRAAHQ